MAGASRSGLRLIVVFIDDISVKRLNGRGFPFGIETSLVKNYLLPSLTAQWPRLPVRDCAPCHASQYPWYNQEELGEMFLGHLIYLASKDKGESSI
jgi:hypothetical protein